MLRQRVCVVARIFVEKEFVAAGEEVGFRCDGSCGGNSTILWREVAGEFDIEKGNNGGSAPGILAEMTRGVKLVWVWC